MAGDSDMEARRAGNIWRKVIGRTIEIVERSASVLVTQNRSISSMIAKGRRDFFSDET